MTRVHPQAPPAVRWIVRTLEEAGYETWAVGGAVRDALLGRNTGDWDLATRAHPGQVRKLFRRTVPIGVEHGTVGVLSDDGTLYEVTTFRRDVETDGRHATVSFADTVEEDLSRRDFTINAVAWHPLRKEMRDPFGGVADLEDGILRAVGTASERFAEDYLRILRALRFAARFRLEVHPDTWSALCAGSQHLIGLSAERIREELLKVLQGDATPSGALELYRVAGALPVLYPEFAAVAEADRVRWGHALATVDRLPPARPFLRLAALLRVVSPKAAAQVLVRLRLSNAQVDEAARRAGAPPLPHATSDDAAFREWLRAVGPDDLSAVTRLALAEARAAGDVPGAAAVVASWRRARGVLRGRPPLRVGELELDGRDLIRLGMRPGPRFGSLLEELLTWVLEDPARNRKELLEAEALRRVSEKRNGG